MYWLEYREDPVVAIALGEAMWMGYVLWRTFKDEEEEEEKEKEKKEGVDIDR